MAYRTPTKCEVLWVCLLRKPKKIWMPQKLQNVQDNQRMIEIKLCWFTMTHFYSVACIWFYIISSATNIWCNITLTCQWKSYQYIVSWSFDLNLGMPSSWWNMTTYSDTVSLYYRITWSINYIPDEMERARQYHNRSCLAYIYFPSNIFPSFQSV